MKIIVKESGKEILEVKTLKQGDTLEQLQKIVGGYIERIPVPFLDEMNIDLFVNEEGKLIDLDNNVALVKDNKVLDVIKGNIVLIGHNEGDSCSLSEEQINFLLKNLFAKEFNVKSPTGDYLFCIDYK